MLRATPPLAIHSQGGSRDDWGNVQPTIIRGLPFTRAFESHVGRKHPFVSGPFTRGMWHLKSRTGRQTDEFRIAYAILSGHTDPDVVRTVILGGPHEQYFREAAVRALAFVKQKVDDELAEVKEPPEKAGVA